MKILVEHGEYDESEVVLRCKELDGEMLEILALLKDRNSRLAGQYDGEIYMLLPAEIYYAEVVDGKTFLYTKEKVLESYHSLASLQEAHGDMGFVRIGKSQLVNLYHVAKLKSIPNTRVELTLKNNEKLIASRHYIQELKEKLGMLE